MSIVRTLGLGYKGDDTWECKGVWLAQALAHAPLQKLSTGKRGNNRRKAVRPIEVQRQVLEKLTTPELLALGMKLDVFRSFKTKTQAIERLLAPVPDLIDFSDYSECPGTTAYITRSTRRAPNWCGHWASRPAPLRPSAQWDDEEDLSTDDRDIREWIMYYIDEKDGSDHTIDFTVDDEYTPVDVESTIRLVSELWPYEGPDWLMWQRAGRPVGRGPWWVVQFDSPQRWRDATMILRDPWDYPFSHLHMIEPFVTFHMWKLGCRKISASEYRDWARAVYDGMWNDFGREEFSLACAMWGGLGVTIFPSDMPPTDASYKPDKHGICWVRSV